MRTCLCLCIHPCASIRRGALRLLHSSLAGKREAAAAANGLRISRVSQATTARGLRSAGGGGGGGGGSVGARDTKRPTDRPLGRADVLILSANAFSGRQLLIRHYQRRRRRRRRGRQEEGGGGTADRYVPIGKSVNIIRIHRLIEPVITIDRALVT